MSAANVTATGVLAELDDYAKQEIRIAAVLNGGVSLAVWISGVVLELHHVALSSQGLGSWRPYRQVLDLLGATARIDVIAGTSAGGLNGAFLALGLARRRDLTLLRDVWADDGSLEKLLRPALAKKPPSVLQGDDYFLVRMREALRKVISTQNPELHGAAASTTPPPVELFLTGTLWTGRESTFTDDMGVGITERDYDATFRFANQVAAEQKDAVGDLDDTTDAVVEQLARAARCTSSFPAAFEPHLVTPRSGPAAERRWPSTAGQANFANAQYVLDGGVLLNKPVRPALEAIYRQPGENQIRRVLAYVVPDPGEAAKSDSTAAPDAVNAVPLAGEVILSILTRLRSTDSVSRELAEIRDRNVTVRDRRRSRARLSNAMTVAGEPLSEQLWQGYMAERMDNAAVTIAHLIAAGEPAGTGAWSEREITDALSRFGSGPIGFGFVPRSGLPAALAATGAGWHWGQTTVLRLMDTTVDLLRRALTLAPLNGPEQQTFVSARRDLEGVLREIRADNSDLTRFWLDAATGARGLPPIPTRAASPNTSAANVRALDEWIGPIVQAWDSTAPAAQSAAGGAGAQSDPGAQRRLAQYQRALSLAGALFECRDEIDRVRIAPNAAMDPSGGERDHLDALYEWLLAPAGTRQDVLQRMLRLEVVLVATSGSLTPLEQEVELVEVSCSNPDRITGMQFHHFGAFYRAPWRVNDWVEGRLDGAKQTMRFLLSPQRLRQRGFTTPVLLAELEKIAAPAGPDQPWLAKRWEDALPVYAQEVNSALQNNATTIALDEVADALAMPLRLQILRDDLATMAGAIRGELADAPAGSKKWLASYEAKIAIAPSPPAGAPESAALSAGQLWDLRVEMADVGRQKLSADFGSDTFARTVSHAATVTVSAFGAPPKVGKVKAVGVVLSALRGYTAMVWAMVSYLTRGSKFGTGVVNLAVAVGATLLAITIFVPGVPIALTLAGTALFLAGMSAAALRTKASAGLGWRLLLGALLIAAPFGWLVAHNIDQHGFRPALTLLAKSLIGAAIVLFGWFLARSSPGKK